MSVKALEKEYQQVVDQYMEMVRDIKEIEEDASNGITDPELVERLKKQIEPIKQNYEWWSWVMFILHEPQRKSKREKYKRDNKKFISTLSKESTPQARLNNSQKSLNSLQEMKNGRTS